jgi:hypothetical protein
MIQGSNPGRGQRFFSSPNHPNQIRSTPTPLFNGYQGLFIARIPVSFFFSIINISVAIQGICHVPRPPFTWVVSFIRIKIKNVWYNF